MFSPSYADKWTAVVTVGAFFCASIGTGHSPPFGSWLTSLFLAGSLLFGMVSKPSGKPIYIYALPKALPLKQFHCFLVEEKKGLLRYRSGVRFQLTLALRSFLAENGGISVMFPASMPLHTSAS